MRSSITTSTLFVKPRRTFAVSLLLLLGALLFLNFSGKEKKPAEYIQDEYVKGLGVLAKKIEELRINLASGQQMLVARNLFFQSRLAYKKIAWAIEYFNPYEARLLNGPALKRTEEDNPQTIIEPQGFQVLEEILFGEWEALTRKKAIQQSELLLHTIKRLREEPDMQYKFQDEVIFNGFRTCLLRLATMGISGFDSPIAQYSLPEAQAVIKGLVNGLRVYQSLIEKNNKHLFEKFIQQARSADDFIKTSRSFEKFDRLVFLKKQLDPLFATVTHIRKALTIPFSQGLMPVNQQSASLFDIDFFNIDFFSPNDQYRVNPDRIALGNRLFHDPILSGTGNRSCASCHLAAKAFTDGMATPRAIDEISFLPRNTPTLWNSVFQTRQFFDSRTATLENQLSDVVHNTREMQGSLQQNIPQLKQHGWYAEQFKKAYKNEPEQITQYTIANAIASYIRSLVALNSRFDQYMRGDETKMNAAEKNGFNLFMGKAKCGTCHYMPLFNGLVPPDYNETESEVLGVPQTKDTLHPRLDPDAGKFGFTGSEVHRFAFKTPTLRNIELTAPYMHNGIYSTLEEVMDFYNKGGGSGLGIAPENQTLPPGKLQLSKKEIGEIIAFMKTLTDTIRDRRFAIKQWPAQQSLAVYR